MPKGHFFLQCFESISGLSAFYFVRSRHRVTFVLECICRLLTNIKKKTYAIKMQCVNTNNVQKRKKTGNSFVIDSHCGNRAFLATRTT